MFDRWVEDGLLDVLIEEGIRLHRLLASRAGTVDRPLPGQGDPLRARATKTGRVLADPDDVQENAAKAKAERVGEAAWAVPGADGHCLGLRKPAVTSSLIGASSVRQLEDSLSALNNLKFSDDELNKISTELILKS